MNLNLKKPCANCPFLVNGAIELEEGRLEDIVEDLKLDDGTNFQCHKSVYGSKGGNWEEGEEGGSHYVPSGNESMCIGSAIYMLKIGRPSISLRFAILSKMITLKELTDQNDKIIEPLN